MRSADPHRRVAFAPVVLGVFAGALLSGCATTQDEAARLRLVGNRERAAEQRVRITRSDPAIRIDAATIVGGRAIVLRVRNLTRATLSDLPVLVSVRRGRVARTLNSASGGDYFANHLPAIPARGTLTWVYDAPRPIPPGRPLALVGPPAVATGPLPARVPLISVTPLADLAGRRLRLLVRNRSGLPQYALQVYAAATRLGRLTAAGRATVAHLGTGATTVLVLRLAGRAVSLPSLDAVPTILT